MPSSIGVVGRSLSRLLWWKIVAHIGEMEFEEAR